MQVRPQDKNRQDQKKNIFLVFFIFFKKKNKNAYKQKRQEVAPERDLEKRFLNINDDWEENCLFPKGKFGRFGNEIESSGNN